MTLVYILIALVVLAGIFLMVSFNGMVRLRNRVDETWSSIEVQLKRRHDLIPNLVETVKGYATHEREAFEAVTQARANYRRFGACDARSVASVRPPRADELSG